MSDYRQMTDEELLARYCATSDPACFEQLVKRHWKQITAWAFHVVGNNDAADDVGQRALLQVHVACTTFGCRSSFKTWLYRIVKNAAFSYLRHRRRPMTFTDIDANFYDYDCRRKRYRSLNLENVDDSSDMPDLRQAVALLRPKHRELVALIYFHGVQQDEAAALLRIPIGTVKSRLHRAIDCLRDIVKTDGEIKCRAS